MCWVCFPRGESGIFHVHARRDPIGSFARSGCDLFLWRSPFVSLILWFQAGTNASNRAVSNFANLKCLPIRRWCGRSWRPPSPPQGCPVSNSTMKKTVAVRFYQIEPFNYFEKQKAIIIAAFLLITNSQFPQNVIRSSQHATELPTIIELCGFSQIQISQDIGGERKREREWERDSSMQKFEISGKMITE